MYPKEWEKFMVAMRQMALPKSCNLRTVQMQLYKYYTGRSITTAQWAEFESLIHRLDPSLPWPMRCAMELGR